MYLTMNQLRLRMIELFDHHKDVLIEFTRIFSKLSFLCPQMVFFVCVCRNTLQVTYTYVDSDNQCVSGFGEESLVSRAYYRTRREKGKLRIEGGTAVSNWQSKLNTYM